MTTTLTNFPDAQYVGAVQCSGTIWLSYWVERNGQVLTSHSPLPGVALDIEYGAKYTSKHSALKGIKACLKECKTDRSASLPVNTLATLVELLDPNEITTFFHVDESPVSSQAANSAYNKLRGQASYN